MKIRYAPSIVPTLTTSTIKGGEHILGETAADGAKREKVVDR